MALAAENIRARAPAWPHEAPYWPCLYFVYGEADEIVSVLYFDGEEVGGHPVDDEGVVQWDEDVADEDVGPVGWCVQVLAATEPDARDPRVAAPSVDVLGPALPVLDAYSAALELTARRSHVIGESYEQSLRRLLWRPM